MLGEKKSPFTISCIFSFPEKENVEKAKLRMSKISLNYVFKMPVEDSLGKS